MEARIAPAFAAIIDLSALSGVDGFTIKQVTIGDGTGYSVSGAGDVNGDSYTDLIIGASAATEGGSYRGAIYVVFGKAGGFDAALDLSILDGSNGFKLSGVADFDYTGRSVSGAGDVNADGFDDLIIGAYGAPEGVTDRGASYVVFGKGERFEAVLALSSLDGHNGFKLTGVRNEERSGSSVAGAGDVNGDGFADLMIGGLSVLNGGPLFGSVYVVFGKADGFSSSIALSTLDGDNGFTLTGKPFAKVGGAGDVNGDGFADLLITTPGDASIATTFVIFGKADGFAASSPLESLNGNDGFMLNGGSTFGSGSSGDLNGDGFADLLIGGGATGTRAGISYVIFGHGGPFEANLPISALNGSNGFVLHGEPDLYMSGPSAGTVSFVGDFNGDGFDDLIVGAEAEDDFLGACYVVFGHAGNFNAALSFSSLNGSNGFKLIDSTHTYFGASVSGAGDVNGDGFSDLLIGAGRFGAIGAGYVLFGSNPVTMGATGRMVSFTDVDGDLVIIRLSKGSLDPTQFLLTHPNALGGATLQEIDFTHHGIPAGASLTITARPGPLGGNGLVNVGYLNAAGLDLGTISIDGDLGRIDAGSGLARVAIKSLTVQSLGFADTQSGDNVSMLSNLNGGLGALTVRSDIHNATMVIGGKAGTIRIGHDLDGARLLIKGAVDTPLNLLTNANAVALKSLSVKGSVAHSQILVGHELTGGINADVKIGTVIVNGNWLASDLVAGVQAMDGFFGNANDTVIAGGNALIVARIANVVIKGQAVGMLEPGGQFGIVAQSIGALRCGTSKLALNKTGPLDVSHLGTIGDFSVREVA